MMRTIRSSVILAACLGIWSCSGDPTADEADVPVGILADPGVVFVTQGEQELVNFQLVDELGGGVPSTWTLGATPAAYTAVIDSTYKPVFDPDTDSLVFPAEQSEIRAIITGIAGGAGSLSVSAGGITQQVSVVIVPTSLPATVVPADVGLEESSVVTMPAGYTLTEGSTFTAGTTNPAYIVSMAPDGSSAEIILTPGSTGPLVITGVEADYLPGTLFTLPTAVAVSRPAQDDAASAPSITLPAVGGSLTFTDPVGDGTDQFYHFTVNGSESIRATISWVGGADVDLLWCNADCSSYVGNFGGATGANPEISTVLLPAGTYSIQLNIYDAHDDPPVAYTITLDNLAP